MPGGKNRFFGSLGDKLGYKQVPCRVRGCDQTWLWSATAQAEARAAASTPSALEPPQKMCDRCQARFDTLADQAVPCLTETCQQTSPWDRLAQLEAWRAHTGGGSPSAPRHMCAECQGKAQAIGDKQLACRVKACAKTWTWTGRAQFAAGATPETPAAPPAARMCDDCHTRFEQLRDRKLDCKVRGCRGQLMWPKWQQLEAELTGAGNVERMCDECQQALANLTDQDVPCRNEGCDGTWIYRRGHQLEALIAGDSSAAPARMCPACQSKFSKLADLHVPCKRTGCKHTWLYKRGAQLEKWLKDRRARGAAPAAPGDGDGDGDAGPPQRLCDACRRGLDEFKDIEVPCKNDGCKRQWTWTRFAQLQAREGGHGGKKVRAPAHMCEDCKTFLTDRKTKTIICSTCAAEIFWAPELQLKTNLGLMQEPTLCGTCKQKISQRPPRRSQQGGPADPS